MSQDHTQKNYLKGYLRPQRANANKLPLLQCRPLHRQPKLLVLKGWGNREIGPMPLSNLQKVLLLAHAAPMSANWHLNWHLA